METNIYVDAYTKGNPGPGGHQVVDEKGNVLRIRHITDVHTNNYYELTAIGSGVIWAMNQKETVIIWSDSVTAIAWLTKNPSQETKERDEIIRIASVIRGYLKNNPHIFVKKWTEAINGTNPADFGRK